MCRTCLHPAKQSFVRKRSRESGVKNPPAALRPGDSERSTVCSNVAERVGFEPTDGYQPSHDFESCAFNQLSHLSKCQKKL